MGEIIEVKVRWNLIRLMFVATIIFAGMTGVAMIVAPSEVRSSFGYPDEEYTFGIAASIYTALGWYHSWGSETL